MKYQLEELFLKNLLRDYSRAIVGKLCKQAEILETDTSLSREQAIDILKKFNKELIYESFRDLNNHIKTYQSGKDFIKFNIYSPTDNR